MWFVIEKCQVRKIIVQSNHLLAKRRQYDPEGNAEHNFFRLRKGLMRTDVPSGQIREKELCSWGDYGEWILLLQRLYSKKQCTNCKLELIQSTYSEVLKSFQLLISGHLLISYRWSSLLTIAEKGCLEFLHEGFLSVISTAWTGFCACLKTLQNYDWLPFLRVTDV